MAEVSLLALDHYTCLDETLSHGPIIATRFSFDFNAFSQRRVRCYAP